jgi:hypothetical protein
MSKPEQGARARQALHLRAWNIMIRFEHDVWTEIHDSETECLGCVSWSYQRARLDEGCGESERTVGIARGEEDHFRTRA